MFFDIVLCPVNPLTLYRIRLYQWSIVCTGMEEDGDIAQSSGHTEGTAV